MSHVCFSQLSIFWQVSSQGWSAGIGEVLALQQTSLHVWIPQLLFFLQTVSQIKGYLFDVAFQHSIFLWAVPHAQFCWTPTLHSGHLLSWQIKGHSWPQFIIFLHGIPQLGIGSLQLSLSSSLIMKSWYLPQQHVFCISGVLEQGLQGPLWHYS